MSQLTDIKGGLFLGYEGQSQMEQDFHLLSSLRHGGQVMRYHTWETLTQQRVSAHSWGVAVIMWVLDPGVSKEAILAGLMHDVAEGFVGDVPATVKWRSEKLRQALHEEEEHINSALGINFEATLDLSEHMLLKVADILDLMFYAYEERRMGNQSMDDVIQNGYNWIYSQTAAIPKNAPVYETMKRGRMLSHWICTQYRLKLGGTVKLASE